MPRDTRLLERATPQNVCKSEFLRTTHFDRINNKNRTSRISSSEKFLQINEEICYQSWFKWQQLFHCLIKFELEVFQSRLKAAEPRKRFVKIPNIFCCCFSLAQQKSYVEVKVKLGQDQKVRVFWCLPDLKLFNLNQFRKLSDHKYEKF